MDVTGIGGAKRMVGQRRQHIAFARPAAGAFGNDMLQLCLQLLQPRDLGAHVGQIVGSDAVGIVARGIGRSL